MSSVSGGSDVRRCGFEISSELGFTATDRSNAHATWVAAARGVNYGAAMAIDPLAGKPAPASLLIDVSILESAYFAIHPEPDEPRQRVQFGTSGHRGRPVDGSFNEAHILAITQAVCEARLRAGITGPLFIGRDSHAVSPLAERTALEVLAANGVETRLAAANELTPTPTVSHAILTWNRGRTAGLADGIVVTPSHNPPSDGGFKYNPPNGGPADTDVTSAIEKRANEILAARGVGVRRMPYERARQAATTAEHDYLDAYVRDLANVVDLDAVRGAGLRIGVDPLGGASVHFWPRIAELYGLDLTVVNPVVDPRFAFMTVDHDGKIRMDCSSPYAMVRLAELKGSFDIACAADPDADRHGIVTPSSGLLPPNHYLAVAIDYLLTHRDRWPTTAAVGKTVVSSAIIDRVVAARGRKLWEVPVGFKWVAPGLFDGSICFGGEESAGASLLRTDGSVWTTDKDGIALGLLAAEITARTGRDPGSAYAQLTAELGTPSATRIDVPASAQERAAFKKLDGRTKVDGDLAGAPILRVATRAPGNDAPIGGIKVETKDGWFAARPSGTEDISKLYVESWRGAEHLLLLITDAQRLLAELLK